MPWRAVPGKSTSQACPDALSGNRHKECSMKFEKDTRGIERYIALDIHKEYVLMGGQNARQEWVMQPRRVGIEKLGEWAGAWKAVPVSRLARQPAGESD